MEDREGNLWAGTTGGGVYLVRKQQVRVFDSRAGLPQDVTFSLCQTPDGSVWFANRSGGLFRWNEERLRPALADLSRWPGPTVVCPGPGGDLYVGTDRGLAYLPSAEGPLAIEVAELRGKSIRCLYLSRDGEVWVATNSRTFRRCRGADYELVVLNKEEDAVVSAISEDSNGRIMVGTTSGELFREGPNGFERIVLGLPHRLSTVLAIAPHRDGTIWVGTSADGILRWGNGAVRFYKEQDGLPDNSISQLLWEDKKVLWGGSRSGIWRLPLEQLDAASREKRLYPVVLGPSDGAPTGPCIGSRKPVSFRDSEGSLWFATRRGAVRVEPAGFRLIPPPVPVHLEQIEVGGIRHRRSEMVQGVPLANKSEFRYTGLLFAAPDRLRFRYWLKGYDSDWVYAGTSRHAVYPQLPPGSYEFAVQARNPREGWSESALLALVVPPAWWQRFSVQLLMGGSAAGLLIAGGRAMVARRFRRQLAVIRQNQVLESERARIARDLHDDLGAGLTHLGHIGHFGSEKGSAEELKEALATVSKETRALAVQMDAIVWTVNPKNDSLPHLAGYLSHFGQEFFRALPMRFRVDRPAELPDLPVSPEFRHHVLMTAKEAFSNAGKHSQALEVWLQIELVGKWLRLKITDNGRGLRRETGGTTGNGLRNMETRAHEIGGRLQITPNENGGTTVVLEAPLAEQP